MSLIWILILSLQIIYPAQAADHYEPFVSVESDENVTLHCKEKLDQDSRVWVWYRQRAGQEPQEVAVKLQNKNPIPIGPSEKFNIKEPFSLTIEGATKDDEGMYFCGKGNGNTLTFFNGTFLAVTVSPDHPQFSTMHIPVSASVPPEKTVTLQCTVSPEIRAAELQVLWFRSVAKNIHNSIEARTYYCAVSSCGKIIEASVDSTVIILGVALGVCGVVIITQSFCFCKRRNCEHCSGSSSNGQQRSVAEKSPSQQDHEAAEMNYASIQFKERKPKHGRGKREQTEDVVYSHVSHATAAHRSNR